MHHIIYTEVHKLDVRVGSPIMSACFRLNLKAVLPSSCYRPPVGLIKTDKSIIHSFECLFAETNKLHSLLLTSDATSFLGESVTELLPLQLFGIVQIQLFELASQNYSRIFHHLVGKQSQHEMLCKTLAVL